MVKLILADGSEFMGRAFGSQTAVSGELVFNTGMVGYPETMTDPSYAGQLVVLTYPLIGNYGICDNKIEKKLLKYFESRKIFLKAIIVSSLSRYHHRSAVISLSEWMKIHQVAGISGIDTRLLTKKLRTSGSQLAQITFNDKKETFIDPNKKNLVEQVSIKEPIFFKGGDKTVLLLDTGCKYNIIRSLLKRKLNVHWVPWNFDLANAKYDGLMIGNGPGDPKKLTTISDKIKLEFKKAKPIFGICLGHQLLAQAAGAKTYKLKFGHRSYNQPCLELGSNRCLITSQNHGYAVSVASLPKEWRAWFSNVNDNSNEGIKHKKLPFQSVQFHPEATPGPTDSNYLFDYFAKQIYQN